MFCHLVLLIVQNHLTSLAREHGVILAGAAYGDHVLKAVWMTAVSAGGTQDQRHKAPAGRQWRRPGWHWTRATWSGRIP